MAQAQREQGDTTRKTRDFAIAAFALMKGLKVVRVRKIGPHEQEFLFDDPDGLFDNIALEFTNSPCAQFDAAQRALKKLAYRRDGD